MGSKGSSKFTLSDEEDDRAPPGKGLATAPVLGGTVPVLGAIGEADMTETVRRVVAQEIGWPPLHC